MAIQIKSKSLCAALLLALAAATVRAEAALLDAISFGNAASESSHHFASDHSEAMKGGFAESARRLLPLEPKSWEGGHMAFKLSVDPEKQNYATIRLWGSDVTSNDLILFCEGKQIGYRHLGDIDLLDIGGEGPALAGRFFYNTTPLPVEMTRGRTNLNFEIRCIGPTWGYGSSFEQYQKTMTQPTRGIYNFYTHTDGFFTPPTGEKQGTAPQNPRVRKEPGPEVLDRVKSRVNAEVKSLLTGTKPLNEMQMQFLARAYFVKWTPACQNSNVVARVLKSLDALFAAYRANPDLAHDDKSTPNPGWFEFGPAGEAISLLAGELKPSLDQSLDDAGRKISRRAAYSEMLRVARDWHRHHRRLYTNQTMINDLYGIYLSNRGLAVVDPTNAFPESEARRYLYEALALEPWRDSDSDDGGSGRRNWGVGTNYWQLTVKGLTKELGYVGYYGEVLDWVTSIYEATRPSPDQPGDEKVKAQLEKIIHARMPFRYPAVDDEGNRAMRIEAVIGWRDGGHYPGNVVYVERPTWDASTLFAAAATLDPQSIGGVQQMFEDNQFFASLEHQMAQNNSLRVTAGLLEVPDQYALIKAQPPSAKRLPMTTGQPDFVFTDEEDGVVAVKNRDEILYVSLYWRARNAVNFLARVHHITPRMDRIAVVREDVQFESSGMTYTRPDQINFGFGNGGPKYPVELHSAHAGGKLPIAKFPADVRFRPGDESVYAGKGDFYALRYGSYLIGQNMTAGKTFELKPPADAKSARDLISGKTIELNAPVKVAPRSTVVLWLGN